MNIKNLTYLLTACIFSIVVSLSPIVLLVLGVTYLHLISHIQEEG